MTSGEADHIFPQTILCYLMRKQLLWTACECDFSFLLTLPFRPKQFIWVWSKSHWERSTSTSPRKLFLPKVS